MRFGVLCVAGGLSLLGFVHATGVTTPAAVEQVAAARPASTLPSDTNAKVHAKWYKACEARVAAIRGKPCDIIFIGDSITQNFIEQSTPKWTSVGHDVWEKHYANRHVLNFGVGADSTQHVLWRLQTMDIRELRPMVAVVLIGTNNQADTPEAIADGVGAVLSATRETFRGVKIILVSILPNARQTEKMAAANQAIRLFDNGKTIFYFDLASKMTPQGNSWRGLGPDRLHLSPEGYELWATEMEPLLTRLLSLPAEQS